MNCIIPLFIDKVASKKKIEIFPLFFMKGNLYLQSLTEGG